MVGQLLLQMIDATVTEIDEAVHAALAFRRADAAPADLDSRASRQTTLRSPGTHAGEIEAELFALASLP
jgi:hypothetical protein